MGHPASLPNSTTRAAGTRAALLVNDVLELVRKGELYTVDIGTSLLMRKTSSPPLRPGTSSGLHLLVDVYIINWGT